ncbi:DUF1576 domain-containing protein [Proteiniclasticum ruminis]|uniref:DUF1576 domain-containing protein n=1 Tax=Proteiniclasticum ruminis TaxID=398199 RepID=A0A1G8LK82_9CLOT|nr:DUF1576 domain-containing protein [Proteiniclasticum ruminis]SDI56129.1 Protein of unknown function [Proteiniclasticum ruminis]
MAAPKLLRKNSPQRATKEPYTFPEIPQKTREQFLYLTVLFTFVTGFFFNGPLEILEGLYRIHTSTSILLSDYMEIGNIGSAFVNSALLMLLSVIMAKKSKTTVGGPLIAAVFTIGGFAFFGKNLYNSLPIMGGVLLHATFRKEPFGKFILPAFFGTALGPLVSQISFGYSWPLTYSIPLGIAAGVLAGFILPPLASQFIRFHQGYNLYNIGFTCGIVGMLSMSLLRGFALENDRTSVLLSEGNFGLTVYLSVLFLGMILFGLIHDRGYQRGLSHLLKRPGQLVSDFVASDGFSVTLLNMGLLGFLSMGYLLAAGGSINGPIIGGIFTVVGFGAFGKHVKNVLPIMAGIYLANLIFQWEVSAIGSLLAALFATTLAPIAGAYGILPGILAGFLHMAVVMNVGSLHGGMNLYNNGFSGGFVAAILVPVLDSLNISKHTWEEDE